MTNTVNQFIEFTLQHFLMAIDDCVVKKILENRIHDSIVPEMSVNLLVSGTYWLIGLLGRMFANGPETWVQSQVASYRRL